MIIETLPIRQPELQAKRTVDSGIVIKTNLAGVTVLSTVTQRKQDIRLYTFTLPATEADALYDLIAANIGKPLTLVISGETITGLISADEFELSTIRPGSCGLKKCSLRVRVISRTGTIGVVVDTCSSSARISDEEGLTIYDESGDIIYEN